MRIYADTNVYVDLFEGRKEKFKDWDEFALQFFNKVRDKEYTLVISDWVLTEIKKVSEKTEALNALLDSIADSHKILVETTSKDKAKARKLSKKNFPDALHVILAKKGGAVYLVTRDRKDFDEFKNIIEIVSPKSL